MCVHGCSWTQKWRASPLLRFESSPAKPAPGITLYSLAILVVLLAEVGDVGSITGSRRSWLPCMM
jgi:hypothetical protein